MVTTVAHLRAGAGTLPAMRDLDTIDSELRLLAAVRWSIREHGGEPSSRQVDEFTLGAIRYSRDIRDIAGQRRYG